SQSPLAQSVDRLGPNVSARVAFTLSEAVAAQPVLSSAPAALSFSLAAQSGFTWVFIATVDGGLPPAAQGLQAVSVAATDIAGNSRTQVIDFGDAGVVVDTEPPAPPATSTPGAIVY